MGASVGLTRSFTSDFNGARIRKSTAQMQRDVNAYIAHMPGTKKAVRTQAQGIAAVAKADLASHRDTGESSIELQRDDTDTLVSLVDEAALSIEYGREDGETVTGKHVGRMQGLHILGRAAGL